MTSINEKVLRQRSILFMSLVVVLVFVTVFVSVGLYITHPAVNDEREIVNRPNILFIVIDDLRPVLGCYGDPVAITPNIDQLASKSVLFTNAFAQQALCAPSRTSFLTSRRPDTLHMYDNTGSYWRQTAGNFTTLPQHFKNNGYDTVSIGKIFHHGTVSNKTDDSFYSWTQMPYWPPTKKYKMDKVCPSSDGKLHMNLVCPVNVSEQPGNNLPDIESTNYAIQFLMNRSENGSKTNESFFLGVGYYKPHIPFKFPKEYLDLYPISSIDLAPNNSRPKNMPEVAWNPWMDLRLREDVAALNISFPYGPIPESFQKLIRQGYYASLSYVDDQIGSVLQAIEDSGYGSNTIIVLLGDHGWSLGEHGEWSKYSNFEVSLKVPLLVYIPMIMDELGEKVKFRHIKVLTETKRKARFPRIDAKFISKDFVELVDIFPTLAEYANLPVPSLCSKDSHTVWFCSEGISFKPVIDNFVSPSIDFSWKTAVFGQYPRPSPEPLEDSDQPALQNITIMGYTIRTEDYRYTEWVDFNNTIFKPEWSYIIDAELYSHQDNHFEAENLAKKDKYSDIVIDLSKKLKKGWRNALPPGLFDSPPRKQK